MTKSEKVRKLIAENPTAKAAEIAKKAKTNVQYVYSVSYLDRKSKGIRKHKRHHSVSVAKPVDIPAATDFNAQIADLMTEIQELTVIIAYLEHRIKVAGI